MQLDGGSKFLSIIKSNPSIQFHISYPYTPQHNGLVERRHRQIMELSLASMFQAQIPYQVLFSKTPDYKFFKVLGCRCFPYTRPYVTNKLAPRSASCVFLGYSTTYKGYKCLHLPTNKIYISRHVLFDENYFPFKETSFVSPSSSSLPLKILSPCPLPVQESSSPTSDSFSTPSTPSPPPRPLQLSYPLPHLSSTSHAPLQVYTRRKSPLNSQNSSAQQTLSIHPMVTHSKTKIQSHPSKALLSTHYPIEPLS
jgi:hypothetical protein